MNQQYKCLIPLAMFYMTIKLVTILTIYKIVKIGVITTTASTLIIPLWFLTGDIITEVYGYNMSKQIIWIALIFQFVFAVICASIIQLPSPSDWVYQGAYSQVLGKLPRVVIASFLAVVSGAFVNAYFISKWKVILKGKYFWLRSLGASIIGEFVFVLCAISIEFIGNTPLGTVFQLIVVSLLTKVILSPVLIIPSSILTSIIKKIEGIEVFDYDIEFNPLKIDLSAKATNDRLISERL